MNKQINKEINKYERETKAHSNQIHEIVLRK